MPAEAALRPRPDGRNRLAAHGRTSHSGSPDRNAAARTAPRRKKLLSFHGESFEICRGHPLRSRASRMARRRTAGRKTPGRNGFGSKDRRMSSYKHHRFPGYGRFLIRSGLFPTTAPAPCPAACDAFRHPASSFRTGRREYRTTLSALRTAIRKRPRPFPRNVRDARRTEAEDGKSSQSPCFSENNRPNSWLSEKYSPTLHPENYGNPDEPLRPKSKHVAKPDSETAANET